MLVYTSAPMEKRLEVTGQVQLVLWAASSVRDTDWAVTVSVVEPSGASYNICEGILRASYRESLEVPSPIEAGQVYGYSLDLGPTSIAFHPGQAIRLRIASSNFPAFARNLGSGSQAHMASAADAVTARSRPFYTMGRTLHGLCCRSSNLRPGNLVRGGDIR